MEIDEIVNDLLEARDHLTTLAVQYPEIENDPLFYGPLETLTKILEDIA